MKVIIVENNSGFAESLKSFIENELDHEVLKIYPSGYEFLDDHIRNELSDFIIINLEIPFLDGYTTGKNFNFNNWRIPMIAIASDIKKFKLNSLISFGFRAAILKKNIKTELKIAIENIIKGFYYFPNINNT